VIKTILIFIAHLLDTLKNPSRTNIADSNNGKSILIEGHKANGTYMYVVDFQGNLIIGRRENPFDPTDRAPHPTLIGGFDPVVQCAGLIQIRNGKIFSVDNRSGHYKPNPKSIRKVIVLLDDLYKKDPWLFSKGSIWRKK
jgi:hypothetical protein